MERDWKKLRSPTVAPHFPAPHAHGVPILYQYSSKRLLYTAINGTCKNTIGGTQWENF